MTYLGWLGVLAALLMLSFCLIDIALTWGEA